LGGIGGGLREIIPAWAKRALWVVCAALLLFVGVVVVSRFQVKRKTAELQESERKYRLLAENVSDVITTMDMNLARTYVSPSVERFTGYTSTELMGKSSLQIMTPESQEIVRKTLEEELAKERQPDGDLSEPQTLEVEVCRKDGSEVSMESKVSFLRDEHGKPVGVISVTRDITQRKKMEKEKEKLQAQLLQSQKMEAIGTLAGGVAHDFNNILTAIQGYTDFAMTSIGEDHPSYRDLKEVKKAAVRASKLTRQLLLFSRRQPMDLTPLNLNRTIENLKKMLIRIIGEDISVETDLEEGIWTVQADAGNIEQVIMNLAVNARDAMAGGGKLTIRTENLLLDEDYCRQYTYAHPGRFVRLSVQDSGAGIDDETISHIFEPFFTTKGLSGGTGLGLSAVYGIVKEHGGWINVYTEPEQGSVFKVYLPASAQETREEAAEEVSLDKLQGSGESVLLVEDEPSVRDLLQRSLSENGYKVLVARTLQEAREVFKKKKGTLDMVLSDVVLPDGTGVELAEELRVQAPELPILLSSGYTDRKSQWSLIKEKGFLFLQKPYSLSDLLRKIKETIKGETMIR